MKKIIIPILFLFISISLSAQKLIAEPVMAFSYKKTAYITMMDGTEIEGQLKKVKRKKGLFEKITIKMEDGEKKEILASEIKMAYLPQNDFDKIGQAFNKMHDLKTYTKEDNNNYIEMDKLKDGYAFFEVSNTQIRKKKEGVVLLQLLNPASAQKIKIYHDPYAPETASIGVAGMKVAGGDMKKSYFVKIGEEKAFRLKKKEYKKSFETIYGKCKGLSKKFEKIKWNELGDHIVVYNEKCAGK